MELQRKLLQLLSDVATKTPMDMDQYALERTLNEQTLLNF